ncbi:uncharacterized protein C1683.06c-like [Homalodisca vitripennis]|uniref:uncharacterized protein C1683.06c-like n=1 Tax=Homalodisca vitripennis TaxID=197043 RepID=UPI001EEC429A|nr:uncharacterized protein C1683.06c-like [Homalodisca vitripennis]KAG8295834.1 hypothetical protein J6590_071655 [Homalodisca vitripennis]
MFLPVILVLSISWASAIEKVIIDADPGVDDAVAILTTLGDPNVQVLGITCVRGNSNIKATAVNALNTISVSGMKIKPKVVAGSDTGLLYTPLTNGWFGSDGFENLTLPNPPPKTDWIGIKPHSAAFIARHVKLYPGEITLITIGPLTNVAIALHLNPNLLQQLKKIIVLGGSISGNGNIVPGVEFNFYMDPNAARFLLDQAHSSGTVLTLVPLETIASHDLTQTWRWNTLAKIQNPAVDFLNKIEGAQQQKHPQTVYTPHDTFATAVLLSSKFVTKTQKLYGFVENKSNKTSGALVVDYFNLTGNQANLEVVTDVSNDVIKQLMFDNLSNLVYKAGANVSGSTDYTE